MIVVGIYCSFLTIVLSSWIVHVVTIVITCSATSHTAYFVLYTSLLNVVTEVFGVMTLLDCYDADRVNVHELSDV